MTDQLVSQRLAVPGGEVYYEVRGSGPLLLVVGQPMTSAPFGPLADLLAEDHTVVTYDPHGLGQCTVDDPSLLVTPEIEADDLALIVEEVGGGPADVFGTSGGAVAGLAMAAHHPHLVRTLIAHEPPVTELVADAPHVRAVIDDVEDTFRAEGSGAAWGKFVSLVMHSGPVPAGGVPPATWPPPGAEAEAAGDESAAAPDEGAAEAEQAPSEKQQADDALFFLCMLKPFTRYEPLVDRLRSGAPRVVVAVGEASREELAKRSAVALAEQLGQPAVVFPGDHAGFMADPAGFAAKIREVLAQSR